MMDQQNFEAARPVSADPAVAAYHRRNARLAGRRTGEVRLQSAERATTVARRGVGVVALLTEIEIDGAVAAKGDARARLTGGRTGKSGFDRAGVGAAVIG